LYAQLNSLSLSFAKKSIWVLIKWDKKVKRHKIGARVQTGKKYRECQLMLDKPRLDFETVLAKRTWCVCPLKIILLKGKQNKA
jgi:hypothetical protein